MSSSRSLIQRIMPYIGARIRLNYRMILSSRRNSSSAALSEPQSSSSPPESIHMTDNFVPILPLSLHLSNRMKELQADEAKEKLLRLSIEAGGCSGFQYTFALDDKGNSDDRIFEKEGVKLVVGKTSFDFVKDATVDYVEELIRSAFQISSLKSQCSGWM